MKYSFQELILYLLSGLALFLSPLTGLLLSVGFAIAFDTFTGIAKSVKQGGWEAFSSKKLSNVISKLIIYPVAVIMTFVIDKYLLDEFLKIWFQIDFMSTKLVTLVLIFIESISIRENFEAIYKIDIFKKLKNTLKRSKELKDQISE